MNNQGGFTLIELILVTVIIGILAGMVTLSFAGRTQEARIKAAKGDISMYQTAIDLYALDHDDKYPKELKELANDPQREYIRELNKDPWGNEYIYLVPGKRHPKSYDVYSAGPDGMPNTEDDVTLWDKAEE